MKYMEFTQNEKYKISANYRPNQNFKWIWLWGYFLVETFSRIIQLCKFIEHELLKTSAFTETLLRRLEQAHGSCLLVLDVNFSSALVFW